MAQIRYIGNKPEKTDNAARTGVVWRGKGDVQTVPDSAVGKLLNHPDVWELVGPALAGENLDPPLGDGGDLGQQEKLDPPLVSLDGMDAEALKEYALRHFGHTFHHRTGEEKMRETIIGLMNKDR